MKNEAQKTAQISTAQVRILILGNGRRDDLRFKKNVSAPTLVYKGKEYRTQNLPFYGIIENIKTDGRLPKRVGEVISVVADGNFVNNNTLNVLTTNEIIQLMISDEWGI